MWRTWRCIRCGGGACKYVYARSSATSSWGELGRDTARNRMTGAVAGERSQLGGYIFVRILLNVNTKGWWHVVLDRHHHQRGEGEGKERTPKNHNNKPPPKSQVPEEAGKEKPALCGASQRALHRPQCPFTSSVQSFPSASPLLLVTVISRLVALIPFQSLSTRRMVISAFPQQRYGATRGRYGSAILFHLAYCVCGCLFTTSAEDEDSRFLAPLNRWW